MTNIEKIQNIVKDFQKYADRKIATYNERVSDIKSKYRPEVAITEIQQNVWPQTAGLLWSEKESAKQKISDVYEDILADTRKWTLRPIKAETLTLLHCIHDFGVKLTINELKMIETEVSGNLLASKIFSGLASEYGYQVAVPSADTLLRELRELKSFAFLAIDGYAGKPGKDGKFPGNDLLEPRKVNGISQGEFAVWEKLLAADFVTKNTSMQRAARIKSLIDNIEKNSISDSEKKEKISALMQSEPDFAAKIDLMGGETKEAVVQLMGGKSKAEV